MSSTNKTNTRTESWVDTGTSAKGGIHYDNLSFDTALGQKPTHAVSMRPGA
jgi:hypothetical protein